jgi:hypothetical protein
MNPMGYTLADFPGWSSERFEQYFGPGSAGGGGAPAASFSDRFSAAPSIDYALQPTPAQQLPQGILDGNFAPSTPRSFNTNELQRQIQQQDNGAPLNYSGGSGPPPGVADWWWALNGPSVGSRDAIASALQGQSYLGAGGPNNSYNPFGTINSGQVGDYDAFLGRQEPASFNDRFGNIPGQPYGQGYFDNTFGSVNAQQGQQQPVYNPTAGGGYPGPLASDGEAQRQQMIQDLYRTLGIIDNAGESGRYLNRPYGDTLQQGDYFSPQGGG